MHSFRRFQRHIRVSCIARHVYVCTGAGSFRGKILPLGAHTNTAIMKRVLAVGAIIFASTTSAYAVAQNVPRTRLRHAPTTPLKHVAANALIDLQSPLRTPIIPVAGGGMNDHEGGGLTNPPEEQFERPIHGGLPAWMAHDHPFQNGHVPGQVYNNHLKEAKEDVIIKPNHCWHIG